MSSILDSKALIKSIKRRSFIPVSQETFTNDDLLEMATEEINIGLIDQLLNARGDYLVQHVEIDMKEDVFAYPIPERAVGNKLRDVSIIDSSSNTVYELSQITLEELNEFEGSYVYRTRNCFYLEDNNIVLTTKTFQPRYKLRMYFYIRPNKLVYNDRAGVIDSIIDNGDGTTSISFTTMPEHFTGSIKYDIVGAASPNKIKNYDLVPSYFNLNTKTMTIDTALVQDKSGTYLINVGDYVTQAEESIVPNIPTELHPIVAQRVAVACLEAMGDEQNKQSAERKLAQMEKASLRMLVNRVEGAPKKIRQRHGTLQSGMTFTRVRRW